MACYLINVLFAITLGNKKTLLFNLHDNKENLYEDKE